MQPRCSEARWSWRTPFFQFDHCVPSACYSCVVYSLLSLQDYLIFLKSFGTRSPGFCFPRMLARHGWLGWAVNPCQHSKPYTGNLLKLNKQSIYFLPVIPTKWICLTLSGLHILSHIFSDNISGILSGISSEILCGGGPAGNTLIRSSQWRSPGEHFDPELAVEVRRGTRWSGASGGGPAGNTLILSLRWRSAEEHSDPELAVGDHFDPGPGGWGPAGITLIQRLLFGSGGEHCDLLQLRSGWRRRGKEKEGRRRARWHKV